MIGREGGIHLQNVSCREDTVDLVKLVADKVDFFLHARNICLSQVGTVEVVGKVPGNSQSNWLLNGLQLEYSHQTTETENEEINLEQQFLLQGIPR